MSVIWPGQSMPCAFGSRDSCTYVRVIHRQSAPIGRLTRKIHCQSRPLVSTPPTNGPSANDAPMAAPYAASAPARSRAPGNAWASSASETANMIAAPMPCTARALLSIAMSCASPQASEARVKIDEADHEQAAPAEAVGERTGGQHGAGERERVGVDDPLQAAEAGVEVLGDAGEGRVDDRDVEHQHRGGGTDDRKGPALDVHQGSREKREWGVRRILPPPTTSSHQGTP